MQNKVTDRLQQVRHIFFDLDHTLWDLQKCSEETLEELFHEYGFHGRGLDLNFFKNRFAQITETQWRLYGEGKITKEQIRERRFVELLGEMGVPAGEVPSELTVAYTERCPRKPHLIPHTLKILERLSGSYEMHILTNGYKDVQGLKMKSSSINNFFKNVITSECGYGQKPDRKIFDHALSITGATPTDALMIGDNPDTDIIGAKKAGWATVFYNPKKMNTPIKPDFEVQCLSELEDLLVRRNH